MISYEGIFFEGETADFIHSLEKNQLPFINDKIHCTFKYHPDKSELFENLIGKEIQVLLIGYGCNGKDSGFELQLPSEIMQYYINYDEEDPEKIKSASYYSIFSKRCKGI